MSRPIALRVAREVLDELQDAGGVYTDVYYEDLVLGRCNEDHPDLYETALEGLVHWAATTAKKQRVQESRRECREPTFPGFDLGGIYSLGHGLFIAKCAARREHFLAALELNDANRRD